MRKSLKIARSVQLVGAVFLIFGIVACSSRTDGQSMAWQFILGVLLILGGKTYEWMTKE